MYTYPQHFTSPGIGQHSCQIHEDSASLDHALIAYSLAGLHSDEAVILVAVQSRLNRVMDALRAEGIEVEDCRRRRQLVLADAEALLARVMPDHIPSRDGYLRSFETLLDEVEAVHSGRIRIYGEMVNLLWHQGKPEAAIQFEAWCNELSARRHFSMFCGYEIDALDPSSYRAGLPEIASLHSTLFETRDDSDLQESIDAACTDVLSLPMSTVLCYRDKHQHEGEHRLASGRRTVYWLQRNMPSSLNKVLARARLYYRQRRDSAAEDGQVASMR